MQFPEDEVVFEDSARGLRMTVSRRMSEEFAAFVSKVVWGTPGGPRYLVLDPRAALETFGAAHYFSLLERGRLIGTYFAVPKKVRARDRVYRAYYLGLLAISPDRKGLGSLLATEPLRHVFEREKEPSIFYGYIEDLNAISLKVNTRVGLERITDYEAICFSRFNPGGAERAEPLAAGERGAMVTALESLYAGHALVDVADSLRAEEYLVLRSGDRIVAGAQAIPMNWKFTELPGLSGRLMCRWSSSLPFMRTRFPTDNLRFLYLRNLYFADGFEPELARLLEAAVARHGMYCGVVDLDRRSRVFDCVNRNGGFGVFHHLGFSNRVAVMARFKNMSEQEVAAFRESPLQISPIDRL
jgi:hypothetical protein